MFNFCLISVLGVSAHVGTQALMDVHINGVAWIGTVHISLKFH